MVKELDLAAFLEMIQCCGLERTDVLPGDDDVVEPHLADVTPPGDLVMYSSTHRKLILSRRRRMPSDRCSFSRHSNVRLYQLDLGAIEARAIGK